MERFINSITIITYMTKDRALIVIGYHNQELEWGDLVLESLVSQGLDAGKISILRIENSPVSTGLDSPYSNRVIQKATEQLGDVGLLVDLHCHPYQGGSTHFWSTEHEPYLYTSDTTLEEKFSEQFGKGMFRGANVNNKASSPHYAIIDPNIYGPSDRDASEAYAQAAPHTAKNLGTFLKLFQETQKVDTAYNAGDDQLRFLSDKMLLGETQRMNLTPELQQDIDYAMKWCEERAFANPDRSQYFVSALADLQEGKIRYSTKEESGIHINILKGFADAYREKYELE
jgi:hypothetical protein